MATNEDEKQPLTIVLLDGFRREIDRRVWWLENPNPGGQRVSEQGDFVSAGPSVVSRLDWWERALRGSVNRDAETLARILRIIEADRKIDDTIGLRCTALEAVRIAIFEPSREDCPQCGKDDCATWMI